MTVDQNLEREALALLRARGYVCLTREEAETVATAIRHLHMWLEYVDGDLACDSSYGIEAEAYGAWDKADAALALLRSGGEAVILTSEREQEIRIELGKSMQARGSEPWGVRELLAEIDRLRAELDSANRARISAVAHERDWQQKADRLGADLAVAVDALERIVREAAEHWQDVDDLDDTGAHVGVARHERAVATGKSFCSSIASEALDRIKAGT